VVDHPESRDQTVESLIGSAMLASARTR
jgi:hypothetical protein